jgi:uncharacterized protein (TIGR02271 family)
MIGGGMTGSTGRRTITAFFDSRQDANKAVERLQRAGIARANINIVEGANRTQGASVSRDDEGPGFWEALKDLFLPDEDRATYAEGLRRGGFIVTVQADNTHYEKAIDILDDEGTVDLDQRAQSWRQEGWTGASAGYSGSGRSQAGAGAMGSATGSATARATGAGTQASAGREEVIPVTEEQLKVGKREVGQGRVRVRSYVVETPVQEQVNLRQENVHVERRPVDRAATGTDNLFRERTIEAEERSEEAVVNKEARVKEELVVKKDVGQRTETVSDKVRRTEVEVEDERAGKARSGERNTR